MAETYRARNEGEDLTSYLQAKSTAQPGSVNLGTSNLNQQMQAFTAGKPTNDAGEMVNSPTAQEVSSFNQQFTTTSQPNPATVNATPYTQSGQVQGTLPGQTTPTTFTSPEVMKQYGGTELKQGLAAAQASGPAPQASGPARSAVQTFTPPSPPNTSGIDAQLAEDKGYQQLLADRLDFNSTVNQSKSILDFYNQSVKDAGLPALNEQLVNMKSVIDGTEDDIRKEVQAASGFATDSQVLALSSARNKQLIKNYNNLIDTKKMAMENITNMTNLASQDRTFALNSISQKLEFDQKINDYRDKFVNNAKEAYKNIIAAVGYDGLFKSLSESGDPTAVSLAEKTMGLAPGMLQQVVTNQKNQANLKAIQEAGITTPYVLKGNEIQNTKTGEGYLTEADFQAKTGMTIGQAGAKGLISKYEGNLDTQVKKQQLEQNKAEAPLELALKKSQLETDALQRANIKSQIADRNKPASISTSVVDVGGKKLLINSQTGATIKEIGSGDSSTSKQALVQAQGNINLVDDIKNKAKNPTSVGVGSSTAFRNALVNPFSSKKSDFIAGVNQLTGQLTVTNLQQAKAQGATFGALSEGELRLLEGSATKLNSWAIKDKNGNVTGYNTSGKSFNAELDKIHNYAKLDYILKGGAPEDVGVQKMPDGTHWTKNSDGSMTQL